MQIVKERGVGFSLQGGMVRKLGLLDLPSLGSVPSSASGSLYDLGQIIFFPESEDAPLSHWENQNLHLTGDLTRAE